MSITEENIEEYILLLLDGELPAAVQEPTLQYLQEHPHWQKVLEEYQTTKLSALHTPVFDYEDLLQQEEQPVLSLPITSNRSSFLFKTYLKHIAAAIIAVSVSTVIIQLTQQPEANPTNTWAYNKDHSQAPKTIESRNPKTIKVPSLSDMQANVPQQKKITISKNTRYMNTKKKTDVITTIKNKKTESLLNTLPECAVSTNTIIASITAPNTAAIAKIPEEETTSSYKRLNPFTMVTHKIPENFASLKDKIALATIQLKNTKIKLEW